MTCSHDGKRDVARVSILENAWASPQEVWARLYEAFVSLREPGPARFDRHLRGLSQPLKGLGQSVGGLTLPL